jgi:hypothetical protein
LESECVVGCAAALTGAVSAVTNAAAAAAVKRSRLFIRCSRAIPPFPPA